MVKLVRGVGAEGMKSPDMAFRRLSDARLSGGKEASRQDKGRKSHKQVGERFTMESSVSSRTL